MNRFLASLLAALALSSCGGDNGKNTDPQPGDGKSAPENTADVDLEAECRAAAGKWKTFEAKYSAEGASNVVVTLAVDRGGRAAMHIEPGFSLLLDGSTMSMRVPDQTGTYYVATLPIGYMYAAIVASLDGKPIPERGAEPPVPAGHFGVELALGLDERGRSERHAMLAVALKETEPFGWLSLLHPQEGFTVRASGRTAIVSGPCGRVEIDRDTGSLVDWQLEPPGGKLARLKRESFATDAAINPALFKLTGQPMPPADVRIRLLQYTLELSIESVARERDWKRRLEKALSIVRAYYRAAWTDAEIERVGALGAKRRHEIAKEYRTNHPDWAQADIDAAVYQTAIPTIGEAIGREVNDMMTAFTHLARPPDDPQADEEYNAGFMEVVKDELAMRALEAGKDK